MSTIATTPRDDGNANALIAARADQQSPLLLVVASCDEAQLEAENTSSADANVVDDRAAEALVYDLDAADSATESMDLSNCDDKSHPPGSGAAVFAATLRATKAQGAERKMLRAQLVEELRDGGNARRAVAAVLAARRRARADAENER